MKERRYGKSGDKGGKPAGARRRNEPATPETPPLEGTVRLNRFIAQAGLCSRREADAWIAEGRVSVNGQPTTEMGTQITVEKDHVEVDGRPIRPQQLTYVLLFKPRDTITTTDDEKDRRTVLDLLDAEARSRGVVPVGRLDRNTTGVLLLTNDGELTHRLMHPSYEVEKLYQVETDEPVPASALQSLLDGVELEDGPARADQVTHLGASNRIGLALHEGRNRQVRRMFEALGFPVRKLERVRYAGLTADGMRPGQSRLLKPHEINALRRLVRLKPLVF